MNPPLTTLEVERLGTDGYFVRNDWLEVASARTARDALHALTGFAPARVGRGGDRGLHPEVRGDELCWLSREDAPAGLQPVLRAFDALKDALNRDAYLGLAGLELQAARYLEAGAHYERHRDGFRGRPGRRVTFLYYLNEGWLPAHGGCLRLHVPPVAVDVPPRLNSLVVFLSDRVEHEVLASFAPRWALTAWWSGR